MKLPHYHPGNIDWQVSLQNGTVLRHALSTPLTITALQLEQALSKTNTDKPELNIAWENTRYLCQLLSSSAHERGIFTVKKSLEELKGLIITPHPIKLIFDFKFDRQIQLQGPKIYLQETLLCLIKNSFESIDTSEGGRVTLSCYQEQHHLILKIQDTGSGMDRMALFFAQLPGWTYKSQGTGVGLTFAKKTVTKLFNGTFKIVSKPQQGTTITIKLPLYL